MKYFEFGQEHSELMVMLHGGGVCLLGKQVLSAKRSFVIGGSLANK